MSTVVTDTSPENKNDAYTPRHAFLMGMRDTVPMILGAIPFGICFRRPEPPPGCDGKGGSGCRVFLRETTSCTD